MSSSSLRPLWDIIGWYGAIALLSAYFLNSFSLISSSSFLYFFLNFTGAIGIVCISYKKKAFPPAILNTVWAITAFVTFLLSILS